MKRIALWTAAAVAAVLVLELLFFLSLTPAAGRARVLGALPDRVEAAYIGYVLARPDGYFRNAPRKCEMIRLIDSARASGRPLFFDPAAIIPYAGNRAQLTYDEPCMVEPIRLMAGRLLFDMGDGRLVRQAFAVHAGDRFSTDYLCGRFNAANLRSPGYAALIREHCTARNTDRAAWEAATGTTAPSLPSLAS